MLLLLWPSLLYRKQETTQKRGGGRGVRGKEQVVVVRGVHGVSWAATITKTRRENITSHIV